MKVYLTIAAAVFALCLDAAQVFTLEKGMNRIGAAGEIVAIEANTVAASQNVTCTVVTVVNEYTNAFRQASTPHVRYDFTITNFDGNAAIATNVFDRFSYADWMRGPTNLIVGAVRAVNTNVVTTVADGKRVKAWYTHREAIGNGTASSHYLKIAPVSTFNFFGGDIDVQCGDGDTVRIMVK